VTTTTTPGYSLLTNFPDGDGSRDPAWLTRLREQHRARFEELGFPTTRLEEWKATSLAPIVETEFHPALSVGAEPREAELPGLARLDLRGPRLVLLDGRLVPSLSRSAESGGAWIGSLARAVAEVPQRVRPLLERRDPRTAPAFAALNTARLADGVAILVPDGVRLPDPVQVVFLSTEGRHPTASHPRLVVCLGTQSSAAVVEIHAGLGDPVYLSNPVGDVALGDGARLEHHRLQHEAPRAFHVSNLESRQGRDSHYELHHFDLGGRLVRHDVVTVLDGEGAVARLNGLYVTRDGQHVDNHTLLDHAKPHGSSREVYKGILDDSSRTVFHGRIVVRQGAQKTDAKQSNPNLLLSDRALAHTRPQLEIHADDVKCTHGATIGRLDPDALFYLQCRGIPAREARGLLVRAFAGEILDGIAIEALRSHLQADLDARLSGSV